MKYAAKVTGESPDAYLVGGYGVVWGGRDLAGERFEKDTDFWFDRITPNPMAMYQHGLDDTVKRVTLGRVQQTKADDTGLWIEAQIDKANEYAEMVMALVRKGVLGWSSGSVPHLVTIDQSKKIVSWPIVEFSLTPEPCEPRTIGVAELESLAAADTTVKAFVDAHKATWSAAQVNDLPDSAFAVVKPGGEKDDDGKTTPRSLRKLPHHGPAGTVDPAHVRNALARLPQTNGLSDAEKAKAQAHLERHLAAMNGDSSKALPAGSVPMDGDGGDPPEGSYEDLIADLARLVRMACCDPMDYDSYAYIVATFPDYAIVCVCDDGLNFFRVPYVIGPDMEPALSGPPEPMARAYVPIETPPPDEESTAMLADYVTRSAGSLGTRLRGLHASRVKEGRVLSAANRKRLATARDAMNALLSDFEDLLAATEPKQADDAGTAKSLVEVQVAHLRARALAIQCGVPA